MTAPVSTPEAANSDVDLSAINDAQQEIVDEFDLFDDWIDRYRYIIDLGRELDQLPEDARPDGALIRGCQSRVWLTSGEEGGTLTFRVATDAAIVAGLIALVLRVYNARSPAEILGTSPWFIEKIGLVEHLSPTRSNGMHAMLGRIQEIAGRAA
jgi:cysteine desulfuration protein SufE